ncbi:carbamoyl phosphate synthase small subunit [Amylocystis lapponica]|nr:carbamoyl phosphate synthase small subunit [Amylocystis lapponica]
MLSRHLIYVPRLSRGWAAQSFHLSRGLATHATTFHLGRQSCCSPSENRPVIRGRSFGAPRSIFGETVFSTSITSYTESMTDPSYRGQILVFTTPLIGNYGVPINKAPLDSQDVGVVLESSGIQCTAVVVADVAEKFSHYTAVESLASWCQRHGVPAITGSTRVLLPLCCAKRDDSRALAIGADAALQNLVAQVSTKVPYELNPTGDVKIAVLDFGAKANILRALVRRGAAVTVLPWNYDFNKWDRPVFGICMGHQVIGMAAGLDAYRMTFGNRGHNQPVLALASSGSIKAGRVYVTSQNHQYALKLQDPFPAGWEPFFINCNDSSVEGIKSTADSGKKVWGVQFHPESAGGPLDTIEMFTDFLAECRAHKLGLDLPKGDVMGAAKEAPALAHEAPRPITALA